MAKQWLKQRILPLIPGMPEIFYLSLVIYAWIRLAEYVIGYFDWPMDGDLSFLYYIAWLMNEHDYIPYRDVHETSFFGTFIFYSALTSLTGYSTVAFHWADLFFFSILSWITFLLLRPFGKLCALLAIALFGEFYFKMGFGVHLQRDFVALLPAALALLILQQKNFSLRTKSIMTGMLFGIASCIKPQFAGGMLVAIGFLTAIEKSNNVSISRFFNIAIAVFAGFAAVWAAGFIWLMTHGVASQFIDMAINYLPAYSSINGRNFARDSMDAWLGAGKWLWGIISVWIIPVAISIYGMLSHNGDDIKQTRFWIIALILWWILYLSYVPMAGKYWGYHILPAYYFLAILLSLVVVSTHYIKNNIAKYLIMTVWLLAYFFAIADENVSSRHKNLIASNEQSRLTAIALEDFLKTSLKDGDRTQAHVSHTRGPVFPALLAAKALPATPYLENYLLYHDVDSSFVKKARQQFLSTLRENPPRYIIYTSTLFGFHGPDTETMFVPFEQWMSEHYQRVLVSHREFAPAFDRVEVYEYRKN